MDAPRLRLTVEGTVFAIDCGLGAGTATLAALLQRVPARVDLHCPKIAGHHIYWHGDFVCDGEASRDVMSMPPGAFFYWPERQMVELAYAPLQAETAAVTLLGAVSGDVAPLRALGERVRRRQGLEALFATLERADGVAAPAAPAEGADALGALRRRRRALWRECPEEITALMARRGVMHPGGPLFFAESEARILQENLWWLRRRWRQDGDMGWRRGAATLIERAIARIGGFCHLTEAGETLAAAQALMSDGAVEGGAVFEEAILVASRLAGWLDFRTPWEDINEAVRAADAGFEGPAAAAAQRGA